MINTDKLLSVAKEAALEAGEVQLSFFGKEKEISHKYNEFDLVTNADKLAEERILSVIKSYFPDHGFLGEESGESNTDSEYIWVIDPIDGTTNYAHNFPHFAVSIGMLYQGKITMGVVYDAFKNEMFWAAEGSGAYLNADNISVSRIVTLDKALLATGFPVNRDGILEENIKYFTKFLYEAQAIRRPGSASLDMCYIACGRLDGFWELNLSPWDVTAAACIIKEAGGKVSNFATDDFNIYVKNIIATNSLLHPEISGIIESLR